MNQPRFTATATICILLVFGIAASGQDAPNPWIPFTARMIDRYSTTIQGGSTVKVEFTGYFARDVCGSTYLYRKLTKSRGPIPVVGATDTATLLDRPNRLAYFIDFAQKTIRKEAAGPSSREVGPLSREQFDQAHAGEESLGKQVISGVECEGYRAPVPKFKKHFTETWYAPSLNFVVIKRTGYTLGRDPVESILENIQVGPPDPKLFRPPSGFREVFR